MELKDLKSAWNKVSSENERKGQLPEEEFSKMLEIRTVDITAKIGRNIRIGIIIVLAWISLWLLSNYIFTPLLMNKFDEITPPEAFIYWMTRLEATSYILIIIGIVIFWIRYNKIEKTTIDSNNLQNKLELLIKILNSYKTMFYIILGVIIVEVIASFSTGFIQGFNYKMDEIGIDISNFNSLIWIIIGFGFLICLGITILIFYLLFNLFFKRLYGRYLIQLKLTLKELNEPVSES